MDKKISVEDQIVSLAMRLAGEKSQKVFETAKKLHNEQGKSELRALADALEIHKCPKCMPDAVVN